MNQLWRNQMLAMALVDAKVFDKVYFSVVKHPMNNHLNKTMRSYEELTKGSEKFSHFDSSELVEAAKRYDDLADWARWYTRVYLDIEG